MWKIETEEISEFKEWDEVCSETEWMRLQVCTSNLNEWELYKKLNNWDKKCSFVKNAI